MNASTPFLYQDLLLRTRAPGQTAFDVLDVGSGPLTCCGYRMTSEPDAQLNVTAVDPLADDYDRALQRAGVTPVVRTQPAPAEELTSVFAADHFDFVFSRNALDHSRDPVRAIRQMLTVVKPGHSVLIEVQEDEADAMGYDGFHRESPIASSKPVLRPRGCTVGLLLWPLLTAVERSVRSHSSDEAHPPPLAVEWNFALKKYRDGRLVETGGRDSRMALSHGLTIRRYAWAAVDIAEALCDRVRAVHCWRGGRSFESKREQRRLLSCDLRRGYSCPPEGAVSVPRMPEGDEPKMRR